MTQAAILQPANRRAGSSLDGVKDGVLARAARKNRLQSHFLLQGDSQLRKLLCCPLLGGVKRGGVDHRIFLARCEAEDCAPLLPPLLVLVMDEDAGARYLGSRQSKVKESASLMFGGVQRGLVQDQAGVGNQDMILLR